MRHTGGLLRRAVSMVVQLENYGLEARFWTRRQIPEGFPDYFRIADQGSAASARRTLAH